MHKSLSSFIYFVVVTVMTILADLDTVPVVGGVTCPDFVPVQNTSLTSIMSNHTTHGWLTLKGTEPRVGCLNFEFDTDGLTREPVVILANLEFLLLDTDDDHQNLVSIAYEAVVPNVSQPGVWHVRDEEGELVYTFYIVYLDDDYSLTVQCAASEEGESRVLFNTRGNRNHLPDMMVQKFWTILQNYEIDVSGYHQVQQDYRFCHQFEFDQ